jgi:type II secretory pathway component GspD/PulD (secretin)
MMEAALACLMASGIGLQQAANPPAPAIQQAPATAPTAAAPTAPQAEATKQPENAAAGAGTPVHMASVHDQRKAAKFYLKGVKLLEEQKPEEAWMQLKQAAELEPANRTYVTAAEVARQSAITQLVQQSNQAHTLGDMQKASLLLRHALELDPKNEAALAHLKQLSEDMTQAPVGRTASTDADLAGERDVTNSTIAAGAIVLEPSTQKHTFHQKMDAKQLVQTVFHAYGIEASVHDSIQSRPVRLDVDDATFAEATHVVALLTNSFYEPLDPHRVIVARDSRENRTQFQRLSMETIYLPGMTEKELTDVSNLARNVFDAQQSVAEPSASTLTLRAPSRTLKAFNTTVAQLVDGRSQLDLDVKIIQLAHTSMRETGTTFFQQTGVYNVFSEIQSVLQQNQSAVQQIISSGLVPNANTLANQIEILAILVASGQLTGTPFNQGFLPFGGGLTQSILAPQPATLTLTLNSSDTRTLEDLHMKLGDDEPGTFKAGMRYPIETSSYSSVALPAALSALTGSSAAAQTIPQIQYEDLGLTLKATPRVMRSEDVAITLELKIESLGGSSLNDIPILNSQQFSGVLTLKAGETAVLLSDLSRQESRALSGLPGVSDIPGLQDVSDITRNQNVARLLILVTPSVIRDPKMLAKGPMLKVDKQTGSH